MKTPLPKWLFVACISAPLSVASAIEPRFAFDFNAGTGTTANGAGSIPVELNMVSPTNDGISLYGANGSGLTGKPGDYALDIGKTTTAMGTGGTPGGVAKSRSGASILGEVTSFTVTGWFKAASKLDGAARLVEYNDSDSAGFILACGVKTLSLSVNKKMVGTDYHSENCFNQNPENQWVFFAVTYDGSKTTDNVVFYGGTAGIAPEVITTVSLDTGKMAELNRHATLSIGNNSTGIRPFNGMVDDIALYSSESDEKGALSPQQINEIYKANLAAAPSR